MLNKKYKLIFFGSPKFSTYSLTALKVAGFEICAVVTQPPKIKGRNKILAETNISSVAKSMNLNVLSPTDFDENFINKLKNYHADIFVVVAYGKIIPLSVLNLPKKGTINIHPSLLPKFRGPSPIQTALLNGEKLTGISLMKLDKKVDHGPILQQIIEPITSDDNNETLSERLFQIGANNLPSTLLKYLNNELIPIPQNDKLASYTKMLKKEDGKINWQNKAQYIRQQINAYQPWPTAYSYCQNKLYKFYSATVVSGNLKPGQIKIDKKNKCLYVGTGNLLLAVETVQPEGKTILKIKDFILGYNLDQLFFTTDPKT
jgi:methionyl-tRNA formyltransferase